MRIPYVDHVVDNLEKDIRNYKLTSQEDLMTVLTRVSDLIEDLRFADLIEEEVA